MREDDTRNPTGLMREQLDAGLHVGRQGLRGALSAQPTRTSALTLALRVVERLGTTVTSFDGPLKRDRPLLVDLLDGCYGVGPTTTAEILNATGLDRRRELKSLDTHERAALTAALRAALDSNTLAARAQAGRRRR